jgi:predicted metal-dependent phosphoesterase TrpH
LVQSVLTKAKKRIPEGFLVDMHIHTNFSPDCYIPIEETLRELIGKVNAITITDHDSICNYSEQNLKAFEIKYQIKVFMNSVEISTQQGDILAYGISAMPSNRLDPEHVIDIIHSEGGIAVAAHPFDILGVGELVFDLNFDAIEINGLRSKMLNQQAKEAAEILGLPLIGGSDSHGYNSIGTCATEFEKPIKTMEDIIKQIKKGKCKPFFL